MGEFVAHFRDEKDASLSGPSKVAPNERREKSAPRQTEALVSTGEAQATQEMGLSIPYPAYMVSYNLDLIWLNDEAQTQLLGGVSSNEKCGVLRFLAKNETCACGGGCGEELLRLHLMLAKRRMSKLGLAGIGQYLPPNKLRLLEAPCEALPHAFTRASVEYPVRIPEPGGRCQTRYAHTLMFREGILFIYVPDRPGPGTTPLQLGRRDEVIRRIIPPPV